MVDANELAVGAPHVRYDHRTGRRSNDRITCRAVECKPAVQITWYSDVTLVASDVSGTVERLDGGKLVSVTSWATVRPNRTDNGHAVRCSAASAATLQPVNATATLNVLCTLTNNYYSKLMI